MKTYIIGKLSNIKKILPILPSANFPKLMRNAVPCHLNDPNLNVLIKHKIN